jgi:colanic acid biosynthesis glycosyl transferase WcaI
VTEGASGGLRQGDPPTTASAAPPGSTSFGCEPQIDLERFDAGGGRRVRIVTPTFYPEPIGTPLYAVELARWLASGGWEVDVVTGQPHYPRFRRYEGYGRSRRRDIVDGIPVHRLPTVVPRRNTPPWRVVCEVNFLVQGLLARRRLGRSPLTIVVTPGVPFGVAMARWLTTADGTLLAWVHDLQSGIARALGSGTALVRCSAALERRCLSCADHVFTLSDGMGRRVRDLGVTRPGGVFPLWSTLPAEDGREVAVQADVQYSGNVGLKQGCGQLLDLAERLHERRPGTTLLIRADAYARRPLELDAARRGLSCVLFADLAPRSDLRRALRAARVHVVPQAPGVGDNVLPSKVVNALAAGCRVVAAGDPGSAVADLAQDHPAMTVTSPGDVEAMADAVLTLLKA